MKFIIEDTNLVDKEFESKIHKKIDERINEFDKNKKYNVIIDFCESFLEFESEIDSFVIPEEYLKPYQKGKELKGKDKMYELLSYRIKTVSNIAKEYGIKVGNCNISGVPYMQLDEVELTFIEKDIQVDSNSKRKRNNEATCNIVMPSLSGFLANCEKAFEEIERRREKELESIFDDKEECDKYKMILEKSELHNILSDFKKEYGDMWMYSKEHKVELKEKFIKTIKVKAGIITDDILKESILKPEEFKSVLIYEIPVYKITKKNSSTHKHIGYIELLTNGRIINVNYQPYSKSYAIARDVFDDCFVNVTEQYSNNKLVSVIRELVDKVDEICNKSNYALEKDPINNVIAYMNLKSIIKKAREA